MCFGYRIFVHPFFGRIGFRIRYLAWIVPISLSPLTPNERKTITMAFFGHCPPNTPSRRGTGMSAFDGIKEPVQSYVDIWTPMFRQASESGLVPDFLLHWGHGAAMASVLLSMGVIGAYMGWQIRLGNGEDVTPLTLGDTIRVAHPKSA
jgi:hypothetical protein